MSPAASNRSARKPGALLRLYRGLSPALCAATRLAGPLSPKLATGIAGRRGLMDRLAAGAAKVKGGVWFHVTSVGEYEQARPIIAAIKERPDSPPVAVTHFSPSGFAYAQDRPCADLHDYLPLDHPGDMARLMDLWQPRLLVFVKFDCWPNQVVAAADRGVPVVLAAGSLQPRSARLRPLARPLFRDVFNRFAHLGVCTPEDRQRFVDELKVTTPVSVTGDTRVEQVILRYEAARAGETAGRLRELGGRLFILGSTWPPDEKLWLPVLGDLLAAHADLRVVLTPHEPSPDRLASLEGSLDRRKIPHRRLSDLMADPRGAADPARAILTDSIGVLAEIYRAGHLTYVGGSFTTGVHNTMEPAVASMPVLFGPVIHNAEEAGLLVRRGAGFVLENPREALKVADGLLQDDERLKSLGQAARQVVLDQRGATERSLAMIEPYLL
ncbi:MAG: glycosyltransferase N-terminal domain-containing protein [Candidatus Krumholzibacteriota bacterium]